MIQRNIHMNNSVVPVELGSAVPAPAQAPQADASPGVSLERVQSGPWRRRIPLPILATAHLTEPNTPTLLTRIRRIIPEPRQHL